MAGRLKISSAYVAYLENGLRIVKLRFAPAFQKIRTEIGRQKKRGTRWLHHEGMFATRAFGHSGVIADDHYLVICAQLLQRHLVTKVTILRN